MSIVQKRTNLCGSLPPKNILKIKLRYKVHVELIGLYSKSIIQEQLGSTIIDNNVIITLMTMVYTATGWF